MRLLLHREMTTDLSLRGGAQVRREDSAAIVIASYQQLPLLADYAETMPVPDVQNFMHLRCRLPMSVSSVQIKALSLKRQ